MAGESSTEAVIAAINVMEDSPLFNAGNGSVFNAAGKHEMDASIMEGAGLNAGAVASVSRIKNPIDLASRVMTDSEHVMLMGDGAEEFARQQGFEMMDPASFYHRLPLAATSAYQGQGTGQSGPARPVVFHRRCSGPRQAWQPGSRHFNRRNLQQTLGPCG